MTLVCSTSSGVLWIHHVLGRLGGPTFLVRICPSHHRLQCRSRRGEQITITGCTVCHASIRTGAGGERRNTECDRREGGGFEVKGECAKRQGERNTGEGGQGGCGRAREAEAVGVKEEGGGNTKKEGRKREDRSEDGGGGRNTEGARGHSRGHRREKLLGRGAASEEEGTRRAARGGGGGGGFS